MTSFALTPIFTAPRGPLQFPVVIKTPFVGRILVESLRDIAWAHLENITVLV